MENIVLRSNELATKPKTAGRSQPIQYGAVLRAELPAKIFKPYRPRLIHLSANFLAWVACLSLIATMPMVWPLKLLLSVVAGYFGAMNGFFAHEILHGTIIRNRSWQYVISLFQFLPFWISPTYWMFSHNKLHHSHTQEIIKDPDAFPTLRIFLHSRFMQRFYYFTPGSGSILSYSYFFFWFTFNALMTQLYFRFRSPIYQGINHTRVNLEFALCLATFLAVGFLVGPANWLWVFVIPFLVQNSLVFSFISTNHNLSPLNKVNDPLLNSLTVTNHPLIDFLTLNFGYHVEHHIFPNINPRHLKTVHRLLKQKYPDRLQVMPYWRAVLRLYQTPRIYKSMTSLIHPKTKELYATLGASKP